MLRAVLTAFVFAFLVAGCPGVDIPIPENVDKPAIPAEAGDSDPYYSENMLCTPPAVAGGGGGGGGVGGGGGGDVDVSD